MTTTEKVGIDLLHMVTGEMVTWYFSEHSVPAASYVNERVQELVEQHNSLVKEHDLPLNEDQTINFDEVAKDKEHVVDQINEINRQILKLQMDGISCILEPRDPLPEGYANKRELLEECIGSYEVIPMIKHLFFQHAGSSITSPAHGKPLILFRRNGKTIDPMKELHQARKKDSASGSSSTG